MRHTLLILVLLAAPLLLFSQPNSGQEPDSLNDATALRPADLVSGKAGWKFSSIDMFTYNFSNGLYGNYGLQPTLMIDGIPVDVNFFGWQSLNMLPIYLPGVNGVRSPSKPSIYNHTIQTAGVIDFRNNPVASGLNAGGNVYLGNETGDPGPWIYDSSRVTPNVDRWGPDTGGLISFGKNNWYGRGTYVLRRHQQTDPLTHRRLHRTMREFGGTRFYPIQTNSQSGMLETGYITDRLTFKARGIAAEDRNYIYLQPFGREVPSEARYGQLAFTAKYHSEPWNFGLRYIVNQKRLTKRNSDHDYVFDWSQLGNLVKGIASYMKQDFTVSGGLSFNDMTTKAPGILRKNDFITGLFMDVKLAEKRAYSYRISAALDIHRNQTATSLKAYYRHRPDSDDWNMQLDVSYSEVLPIRQHSFGYWITRGYNFHRELDIDLDRPLGISKNRLIHISLRNTLNPTDELTLSITSELTHHYELNIPWQQLSYDLQTGSAPGIFNITGEQGTQFDLQTTTTHRTFEWLRQEISIELRTTLQGSSRYEDYFRQVPGTHIKYKIDVAPVRNLSLTLQGKYRSSTHWKEFDALEGKEYRDIDNLFPIFSGTYNSTVPPQLDIEIGAKKWFWEKRLSLQFTVQNLLNNEVRLHPFGADQALMFNIQATAAL